MAEQRFDDVTLQRFRRAVFQRRTKVDPAAALTEGIRWLRDGKRHKDEVESAFAAWVGRDAKAATDWWRTTFEIRHAGGTTTVDLTNPLALHMSFGIAKVAPELAVEISENFQLDFPRRALRMNAFNTWLEQAPRAAYQWASRLESPADRFDCAWRMMKMDDHAAQFGEEWQGPDEVIAWALARTTPDQRPQALAAALGYWGGMGSLEEAADWLMHQPKGEEMDVAFKSLATVKRMPKGLSMNLAASVTDSSTRDVLVSGIFRRWHREQPRQAALFLEQSGWPAEQLRPLEEVVKENNG